MAQMLLERPMKYAIEKGHNSGEYQELLSVLIQIRKRITPEMHGIIDKYETNPHLRAIIKKSIPKEGSYHRGSLVDIVASSNEKHVNNITSAAAELFYWTTAWLDDIADENTFRQDADSIRKSSGNNIAMYASNALYGIVFRVIRDEFQKEPEKLAKIMGYLSTNFHIINKGQAIDAVITNQPLSSVSLNDYISLIEETTGVDVASNIGMGAVVGELDSQVSERLYRFGLCLGTLAQIRDDVLDYCDVKSDGNYVIGKLPFRDLETGKRRLPLLLTKDTQMRRLPNEVYDTIEREFIAPRKSIAQENLSSAEISPKSKRILGQILDYWSDIRLFQKISS